MKKKNRTTLPLLPNGRCGKSGKITYATRIQAEVAMKEINAKGTNEKTLIRVYHCDHCDTFHTSSIQGNKSVSNQLKNVTQTAAERLAELLKKNKGL